MSIENFGLFAVVAAAWALLSPLAISLIKDVGKSWNTNVKKLVALAFSVAGAYVAYGSAEGWTNFDIEALSAAWLFVWPAAQVSYSNFWSGTAVETKLAAVGTGDGGDPDAG